jgi:hypothetical protein
MTDWPTTLPQQPLESGYEQKLPASLESKIEGALQQRLRSWANPIDVSLTVRVLPAEKVILDAFYDSQCVLPFNWKDHLTDESVVYRIADPPEYKAVTGLLFDAMLKLEMLQ